MKIGNKIRVGVIGCGKISDSYFPNLRKFPLLETVACADLDLERARISAEKHGIPKACSAEELLRDAEIDLVLNLTIPKVHAEIALASLNAGKSVHGEKPLAVTTEEGKSILEKADALGLKVGSAPDTFLGAGIQTCRKLIDDGAIGTPVAANAFMLSGGHENWHPDPGFYYQPGGGPMFDMGPYYITALVNLLGPIKKVTGMTRITYPERIITSKPKSGDVIKVNTPTHIAGIMRFESGAIGNISTSFDVKGGHTMPCIEIYGSEGSMLVPDPNGFGGSVKVRKPGRESNWEEQPLTHKYTQNSRGVGLADLAYALKSGRPHRASGKLAYHVLEVMQAFLNSSDQGNQIEIESTCERPAPMRTDLEEFVLEE